MTQDNSLMAALELCPHDLGEADIEVDDDEWNIARVVCKDCGAAGPYVLLGDHDTIDQAKAAAANLWNERPGMANADRAQPDLFLSRPTQPSGEAVDLLTKAVADIAAALSMGGKDALIAKWTAPYVRAINAHPATRPAHGADKAEARS